jgi:uncharacterized delta-60 repeat protein
MGSQLKVAGEWKSNGAVYSKVNGSWKLAQSAWAKDGGVWKSWFLRGGLRDSTFNSSGSGANATVRVIISQSDGKILVGGDFTTFNGSTANYIVRLNSNGTVDTSFSTNNGSGANGSVKTICIQSDGKILVGGDFTTFNGTTVNRIVRLNTDGTPDTTFTVSFTRAPFGTEVGFNGTVWTIATQSDGKILVGGNISIIYYTFDPLVLQQRGGIRRLNTDGTIDLDFLNTLGGTGAGFTSDGVRSIVVQPDDKILLGGSIPTIGGTPGYNIARLNSDGAKDTEFLSNIGTGSNNLVHSIALQSDGKIVVGGATTVFNGNSAMRLFKLSSNGIFDLNFNNNISFFFPGAGFNNQVFKVKIQNNKILVGGAFSDVASRWMPRLGRLDLNGIRDGSFSDNLGSGVPSPGNIFAVELGLDNKVLVGGDFTTFNNISTNRILRVGGDLAA